MPVWLLLFLCSSRVANSRHNCRLMLSARSEGDGADSRVSRSRGLAAMSCSPTGPSQEEQSRSVGRKQGEPQPGNRSASPQCQGRAQVEPGSYVCRSGSGPGWFVARQRQVLRCACCAVPRAVPFGESRAVSPSSLLEVQQGTAGGQRSQRVPGCRAACPKLRGFSLAWVCFVALELRWLSCDTYL